MRETSAYLGSLKKQRRRRKLFVRISLFSALFLAILSGIAWLIINLSILQFREIVIGDQGNFSHEKIVSLLQSRILGRSPFRKILGFNNFLIWPKYLNGEDLGLADIESLSIKKDYFKRILTVNVQKKDLTGIWCRAEKGDSDSEEMITNRSCWLFNHQGEIFKESPATSGNLIKVVDDYSGRGLSLGSKILPEEFIPHLISILKVISESGINNKTVVLENLDFQEVRVPTRNGPDLYFSLRHPASSYLSALKSLVARPDFQKLRYVDLRIPNRVYTSQ